MFVICPGHKAPVLGSTQLGSGAARVTYEPYLARSARMNAGETPETIVCCKSTDHQSNAKEALLVGSSTMPSVRLVEVSGWRAAFPPIVIGNCVTQSFELLVVLQRAGSFRPGAVTPMTCG